MPGECILEVQQAEMGDTIPALDQHDVLRVVIAKDGYRGQPVVCDGSEHVVPGPLIRFDVHDRAYRWTIPVREQLDLIEPLSNAMLRKSTHRRVFVKVHENVGRELVKLTLSGGVGVERFP